MKKKRFRDKSSHSPTGPIINSGSTDTMPPPPTPLPPSPPPPSVSPARDTVILISFPLRSLRARWSSSNDDVCRFARLDESRHRSATVAGIRWCDRHERNWRFDVFNLILSAAEPIRRTFIHHVIVNCFLRRRPCISRSTDVSEPLRLPVRQIPISVFRFTPARPRALRTTRVALCDF